MTRTHSKYFRVFMDGVDISGYSRTVGSLGWDYDVEPDTAVTDGCKNSINGKANISAGDYSAFMDNDTAGLFALANASQGTRVYTVALGALAAPAQGDNVFTWKFEQSSYSAESGSSFQVVSVALNQASYASPLGYSKPWGILLHAKSAETAVNSSTGIDDTGASSALGGVFIYHMLTSNGTATLKAQHAVANNDGSFADLTGATSGSITAAVTPKSGMVELSQTETINRYIRWQITLGSATTVTFVTALIRN